MNISCPLCNSTKIEDTGRCIYTYPSYNVYKCLNCGKEFDICNDEEVPHLDFSKSKDITNLQIKYVINCLIEEGQVPEAILLDFELYNYVKYLFGKLYFVTSKYDGDFEFVHITIDKDIINKAIELHKYIKSKEGEWEQSGT